MNAAVVHAFDAPPRYSPFADPVPADGEALVTVTAAALHPIVKALARGTHYGSTGTLPFVPESTASAVSRLPSAKSPPGPASTSAPPALIATNPLHFALKTAPLRDIESLWNTPEQGVRLVFQP